MGNVHEPKNTAEAANATVTPPPAPGPATPQSGGVQTESGHRDIYEKPEQRPEDYWAGASPTPPAEQGPHGPDGRGTGPTVSDGGRKK